MIVSRPGIKGHPTNLHTSSQKIDSRYTRFDQVDFAGGTLTLHDQDFLSPVQNRMLCFGVVGFTARQSGLITGRSEEVTRTQRLKLYRHIGQTSLQGAIGHSFQTGLIRVAEPPAFAVTATGRQQDILDRSSQGMSRREVAEELGISEQTVMTHLNRTYAKWETGNLPASLTLAYMSGVLLISEMFEEPFQETSIIGSQLPASDRA